ncbi:MAG: DUF502 domain-containing protein [Elusimicrobiota bacterium]
MIKITKRLKAQFITGLIVILPVGLTVWIILILFRLIGNRFLPIFANIQGIKELPIVTQMTISAILTLIIIWFAGFWARNFTGRLFIRIFEKLVYNTPVVSKIYKTIRKITDTMFVNKQAFKKVALIEYPRRGLYTMAFVTNEESSGKNSDFVTVFIPSTPNPTTGYCIILPKEDVDILPISINQAMEFIFSGGMIVPEELKFPKLDSKNGRIEEI